MMNRLDLICIANNKIIKENKQKEITFVKSNKFDINKLKKEYSKINVKNKDLEKAVYVALSFYPELKNTKITFKQLTFGIVEHPILMAAARFKTTSILTGKRHYVILLNKKYGKYLLKEFSFNSTVYLIAHELSHVVDYEQKSRLDLLKFGAKYLIPKHRLTTEFETDIRVIHRGLGEHMKTYLDDINNSKSVPSRFKKYRSKYYLVKKDIKNIKIK